MASQLPFTPLQPYGVPGLPGQLGGVSLSNFLGNVKRITTGAYTLQSLDSGSLIVMNRATRSRMPRRQ